MVQFCYLRLYLGIEMFPVVCCEGSTWIETWKSLANLVKFTFYLCKHHLKSYYGDEICLVSSSLAFCVLVKVLSNDSSTELT